MSATTRHSGHFIMKNFVPFTNNIEYSSYGGTRLAFYQGNFSYIKGRSHLAHRPWLGTFGNFVSDNSDNSDLAYFALEYINFVLFEHFAMSSHLKNIFRYKRTEKREKVIIGLAENVCQDLPFWIFPQCQFSLGNDTFRPPNQNTRT